MLSFNSCLSLLDQHRLTLTEKKTVIPRSYFLQQSEQQSAMFAAVKIPELELLIFLWQVFFSILKEQHKSLLCSLWISLLVSLRHYSTFIYELFHLLDDYTVKRLLLQTSTVLGSLSNLCLVTVSKVCSNHTWFSISWKMLFAETQQTCCFKWLNLH